MIMTLILTTFLASALYFAAQTFGGVYPIYGTLSQVTFYGVTALYLWHLLVRGRR